MVDIVALGESLIDFTPAGINEMGMQRFSRNPGGAPANVLAMSAKLGGKTAFIGKVGKDDFGAFLIQTMVDAEIDVSGVCRDEEIPTTLAFVQLDEQGDRSFTFYRKPGADIMLQESDLPVELLENCGIFHFGSVSLTDEPCRSATLRGMELAKEKGAVISYDPNYRPFLWKDSSLAKEQLLAPMSQVDLLKVSEEEMELLAGTADIVEGATQLAAMGPTVVVVTRGPDGSYFHAPMGCGLLPAHRVDAVDTTGSGDAFWGSLLWALREKKVEEIAALSKEAWVEIVRFSNAAGGLTACHKGAIPAMPTKTEIERCMTQVPLF